MEVKKELKRMDTEHKAGTGIKRCWYINSYEEVVECLKCSDRIYRDDQCINTYDFSTMYTTLDLKDLVECLGAAIKEAFGNHRHLLLKGNCAGSLSCIWDDEPLQYFKHPDFTLVDEKGFIYQPRLLASLRAKIVTRHHIYKGKTIP